MVVSHQVSQRGCTAAGLVETPRIVRRDPQPLGCPYHVPISLFVCSFTSCCLFFAPSEVLIGCQGAHFDAQPPVVTAQLRWCSSVAVS